ncbi:hypothetical protein AB4Y45_32350 [Paraburkholderia sp. EG287A]|uniref:hypothetical protein n=1 Tax=Paraburkholderia sp. EG287A TaxID=3237012 RepID=UPI0034D2E48D
MPKKKQISVDGVEFVPHAQFSEAPTIVAGYSELYVGLRARVSVNVVSWYDAATNQAGEGLWRKPEEVAAHVERLRADYPEAEISVNGKAVPDSAESPSVHEEGLLKRWPVLQNNAITSQEQSR